MNIMKLQKFKNNEFKLEAFVDKDKNIYFKAKDVAISLGYEDTKKAIAAHVFEKYKTNVKNISSILRAG